MDAIDCWPTGSRLELQILLYRLAKRFYPKTYLRFLKLRMPWFVSLHTGNGYPRLETGNRLHAQSEASFGPFASRGAAQQYEQEVLSLFQVRRCSDALAPDPTHPGCMYGEMNQCLRPCQQAVSRAEYSAESGRLKDFLATNGRGALAALSAARDRACQDMEFEPAAQVHKRIEKLKAAAALREPVITELGDFSGVALTRSLQKGRFLLWPMLHGSWQMPLAFELALECLETKSLDSALRELLAPVFSSPRAGSDPVEELAIFSRWYYSSWRDGEWFPSSRSTGLNYRRLVRELSKMAHPLTSQAL